MRKVYKGQKMKTTKLCKYCNTEKELYEFRTNHQCYECAKAKSKEYYNTNKEKRINYIMQRRDRQKYLAYQKTYRENDMNKEKIKDYRKNGIKELKNWYVRVLLMQSYGYLKEEITPELIKETRRRLLEKRREKN